MPNSKTTSVRKKHLKRQKRIREKAIESLSNAKVKTLRNLKSVGSLPKVYRDKL